MNGRIKSFIVTLLVSGSLLYQQTTAASDFEKFEIRVIRPKFFSKKGRFEAGAQLTAVTNQTFIYTYLATGILDFHITEQFALELAGAYGFSFDKQDKTVLKDNFKISTTILRTKYYLEGALLYTPIYGKYQMTSGRLIYFDTFISAGGGLTGIEYLYDHCKKPEEVGQSNPNIGDPPAPKTQGYPTGMVGVGQRFFLNKHASLRWDIKGHVFAYNTVDGSCNPNFVESGASRTHENVTVQFGYTYFM